MTRVYYPSRDYYGSGAEITKPALIFLPPGYSTDRLYDVLILCHGIGGTETEWGFQYSGCAARRTVEHLTANGEILPPIIVMPNCRASARFTDTSSGSGRAFFRFGEELRNDLLPWIDENYPTYGSLHPGDPAASREHRAIAGLSMGAALTVNVALCECSDLFASFGAFSAPVATFTAARIAELLGQEGKYPIRLFYSICGKSDRSALDSAYAAVNGLADLLPDRFSEENLIWQVCPGGHGFSVWNTGLYNFVRMLYAAQNDPDR